MFTHLCCASVQLKFLAQKSRLRELVAVVTKYMLKMSSTINLRLSGRLFWRPKSERAFTLNLQFLAYVFLRVQCSRMHGGNEENANTNGR